MTEPKPRSRAGGRAARRTLRSTRDYRMLPGLERKIPDCEVMDQDHVEMIDAASMDILENVGVQFRDPIALDDWRKAGAKRDQKWQPRTRDRANAREYRNADFTVNNCR